MAQTKIIPGETLPSTVPSAGNFALSFNNISAGIEGDFGAESSRIPFLSIVQRTSDIVETRPETLGMIVYAGKVIVPKPATLTIFGARQYYKQNLAFERNPSVRAKTFATKEQVLQDGGNLERFIKAGVDERNYVPELVAKVVLFSPAKGKAAWAAHDEIMSHPAGANGTLMVPMLWTLRGVAYGQLVPALRMVDRALREDQKEVGFARFSMNVVKQTFTSNSTFVPVLDRLPEDNSKEVVEILHEIFDV